MSLGSVEDQERKLAMYGEEYMPTQAEDLLQYLAGEFQAGEPFRITTRRSDAVGRQIADREVSRLEILSALTQLRHRQRRIVEMLYVERIPGEAAADRLGISLRTLYRERSAALDAMASAIYEWE